MCALSLHSLVLLSLKMTISKASIIPRKEAITALICGRMLCICRKWTKMASISKGSRRKKERNQQSTKSRSLLRNLSHPINQHFSLLSHSQISLLPSMRPIHLNILYYMLMTSLNSPSFLRYLTLARSISLRCWTKGNVINWPRSLCKKLLTDSRGTVSNCLRGTQSLLNW